MKDKIKKYNKLKYWILIILIGICFKFLTTFLINEFIILNYHNNIYNTKLINLLHIGNFSQSYIANYNHGNIDYNTQDYSQAIIHYQKALDQNPPQKRVCDIRINLSLALIQNIDSNDYDKALNELSKARKNLYENDCAHENDDNGYSPKAEELEKEIRELENSLQPQSGNSSSTDNNKNNDNNENRDYSDIEKELKEQNKENQQARQDDMSDAENMSDWEYYDGKNW